MEGLVVVALFYFLPALIALLRGHHNGFAIFLTNVLLGWTGIGWIVALIWSTTASQPRVRV
ncbi:superinfection immunity protein [Maricaulaceae bacterium NA33B04]|nr:superinfection immunity protein [Maricaulaceae bacterium NA33B04]